MERLAGRERFGCANGWRAGSAPPPGADPWELGGACAAARLLARVEKELGAGCCGRAGAEEHGSAKSANRTTPWRAEA